MKNFKNRKSFIFVFVFLFALLVPGYKVYGMDIGDERKIREKLVYSMRNHFSLMDDPDISQYINELGGKVIEVAGTQFFDYRFFVVNSDQFNAFATPGGLIFFYSGLISKMNSEDELLGVMAHEVAHVSARHISKRVESGKKISALSVGLGLAAIALGQPELIVGAMAAGQSGALHFSRQDEEYADRIAYDWMKKMGRNPEAMLAMLKSMRRISRYSHQQLPQYLLTHPNPEFRLDYVSSLLDDDSSRKNVRYIEGDDFSFFRFKYRIMNKIEEPERFKHYCLNEKNRKNGSVRQVMADYGFFLFFKSDNNFSEAEKHLELVLKSYPKRENLKVDQALLYKAMGRDKAALALLEGVVKGSRANNYAAFELAKLLADMQQYIRAEALFNQLSPSLADNPRFCYEFARVKAESGDEPSSRFYLAKYYLLNGDLQRAKMELESLVAAGKLRDSLLQAAEELLQKIADLED